MTVRRIVANIQAQDVSRARQFYGEILGLDLLMDHDWIQTYGNDQAMSVQVSIASQGGSDTPVPDLSIEVDDVDVVFKAMKRAKFEITYDLTDEPWGVRRFYVCDPFGKQVNILAHL